jgi:hypothetical protein
MLQIVAVEPVAPGPISYSVRNISPQLEEFRIDQSEIVSSRLTIEPGQTRGNCIRSDPRTARIGGVGAQLRGETGAELSDHLTTTWR